MKRLAACLLLAVAIAFHLPAAAAAEVGGADQEAVRSIITGQIDAFRRDDGAAAYGYAAPSIKGLFPSVDAFMGMVRNSYAPVYRPRSLAFGPITATPNGLAQRVFLTGPDGRNWVAIYDFEKQPDGTWKINGVRLLRDSGPTI